MQRELDGIEGVVLRAETDIIRTEYNDVTDLIVSPMSPPEDTDLINYTIVDKEFVLK